MLERDVKGTTKKFFVCDGGQYFILLSNSNTLTYFVPYISHRCTCTPIHKGKQSLYLTRAGSWKSLYSIPPKLKHTFIMYIVGNVSRLSITAYIAPACKRCRSVQLENTNKAKPHSQPNPSAPVFPKSLSPAPVLTYPPLVLQSLLAESLRHTHIHTPAHQCLWEQWLPLHISASIKESRRKKGFAAMVGQWGVYFCV